MQNNFETQLNDLRAVKIGNLLDIILQMKVKVEYYLLQRKKFFEKMLSMLTLVLLTIGLQPRKRSLRFFSSKPMNNLQKYE